MEEPSSAFSWMTRTKFHRFRYCSTTDNGSDCCCQLCHERDGRLPTLVGNPFALLNRLGPGTERHEVALHNVLCIGRAEPQGQDLGEEIRVQKIVTAG